MWRKKESLTGTKTNKVRKYVRNKKVRGKLKEQREKLQT